MLAVRMQNDIAFVALQGTVANQAGAASALTVGQSLLSQLRQAKAVGRLVINLPALLQLTHRLSRTTWCCVTATSSSCRSSSRK